MTRFPLPNEIQCRAGIRFGTGAAELHRVLQPDPGLLVDGVELSRGGGIPRARPFAQRFDGIPFLPRFDFFPGPVIGSRIALVMTEKTVSLALDQRGPLILSRAGDGCSGGVV